MNRAIRIMFVVIAAVLTFTAIQAFGAGDCSETVEGIVSEINNDASTIVVDGTTVKGISLVYLANQFNIVLEENVSNVVITAHPCEVSYDNKLRACTISVDGGEVIDLPGR